MEELFWWPEPSPGASSNMGLPPNSISGNHWPMSNEFGEKLQTENQIRFLISTVTEVKKMAALIPSNVDHILSETYLDVFNAINRQVPSHTRKLSD